MNLNFLGRGAAFNPKEGNNSAFFIDNNDLFLIDCGESIFERIIEYKILENVNSINVMITHTHSDHIGSIGSLVMYCFYALKKNVNIILPENPKYLKNIKNILDSFGCVESSYKFCVESSYDNKYKIFNTIRFIETKHCTELNCYGLVFNTDNGIVYYSGDTKNTDSLKKILESSDKIDKIYIDVSTINTLNNVHTYIGELSETIPNSLKEKVYCMHINNDECIDVAKKLGFNVVEVIKKS